jgi:hypothetical protein
LVGEERYIERAVQKVSQVQKEMAVVNVQYTIRELG